MLCLPTAPRGSLAAAPSARTRYNHTMRSVPLLLALMLAIMPLRSHASPVSAMQGASTYEASSSLAPGVRNLTPAPGTTLKAFFPRLSATLETHGAPLRSNSLHLYVDGKDVTARATVNADSVAYVPQERLHAGWHDVFLEGSDSANNAFSQAWIFRSQNPDIEEPIEDNQFAFVPVGRHGRFAHFFLVSPFDGFGLLQLCGFEFPLHRAGTAPVFFVTVPITLGTALLGCNPGLSFTPFQAGIGVLNPIFFPIEIAGPGIFQNGGDHHRRHPLSTTAPAYGVRAYSTPGMPVYQTQAMPIYRTSTGMPIYRTSTGMPVLGSPVRAAAPPRTGSALPALSIPQPSIPRPPIPH